MVRIQEESAAFATTIDTIYIQKVPILDFVRNIKYNKMEIKIDNVTLTHDTTSDYTIIEPNKDCNSTVVIQGKSHQSKD